MPRTSTTAVQTLLGANYGPNPDGSWPDLTPYVDTAENLVNSLVYQAKSQKRIKFNTATLELIERWLAAHCYTKMDPTYTSKSTSGASGSFVRGSKEPEPYKDMALSLDYSGCLNALLNRQRAGGFWNGTEHECTGFPYDTW